MRSNYFQNTHDQYLRYSSYDISVAKTSCQNLSLVILMMKILIHEVSSLFLLVSYFICAFVLFMLSRLSFRIHYPLVLFPVTVPAISLSLSAILSLCIFTIICFRFCLARILSHSAKYYSREELLTPQIGFSLSPR